MNIASECFDNSIRAEKIIWLSCQADQYTDELREFFTDCDTTAAQLTQIFGGAVKFKQKELAELDHLRGTKLDDHIGEFMSRLYSAKKRGFLVQAATPVPQMFGKDGGVTTYGFGHYTTKWFYTEALDEAFVQSLIDWKEAYHEKQRKGDAAKKVKPEAV